MVFGLALSPTHALRPLYLLQELQTKHTTKGCHLSGYEHQGLHAPYLQASGVHCLRWVSVILPASPESIIDVAQHDAVPRGGISVFFYVAQHPLPDANVHALKH